MTSKESAVEARLRDAYEAFLDAAATVAGTPHTPPDGDWDDGQILAHVAILTATTIRAAAEVAAGEHTTYDNRISHDDWTLEQLAGTGSEALRDRIRAQSEALCAFTPSLSKHELQTQVATRLVSHGAVLVDQPLPLGDLLAGFADNEVPGHTAQLLALIQAA